MGISRTILKPLAYLAGKHASSQVKTFLAAHKRTRDVQQRLLRQLLAAHGETDFGRDHGFAHVKGHKDFKSAVPIGSYETLRPYMRRVLDGQTTALLPPGEKPLMFSMTSGTTGKPKYIPVTQRFLADMQRGWNIFGLKTLQDHKAGWLRGILQISSPMSEKTSPTGLPCGAISGLLAQTQKKIVRRMYVVPRGVYSIADPAAKYYTILRCGVGRDVAIITTANPSSTIKLIETGQLHAERLIRDVADGSLTPPGEFAAPLPAKLRFKPNRAMAQRLEKGLAKDGRLLPRHFWNIAFLTNWTGGTLKLYIRRLRELFGDVPIRDIGLLASEGRFSIPIADGTPAGLAEITSNFLEFIPAACHEQKDPPILLADELEVGEEYFLMLSNWAGLWRYDIDDCIRVVDRFGQSPVFEFLSRGPHTANITGEKITEYQVVEAMRRASRRAAAAVDRFVVQGRFAAPPHYELRMETPDGCNVAALTGLMDEELCQLNMEYQSKRAGGRLGPIRMVSLDTGKLERIEQENIRRRNGRSEQYKHKYLLTEILSENPAD